MVTDTQPHDKRKTNVTRFSARRLLSQGQTRDCLVAANDEHRVFVVDTVLLLGPLSQYVAPTSLENCLQTLHKPDYSTVRGGALKALQSIL